MARVMVTSHADSSEYDARSRREGLKFAVTRGLYCFQPMLARRTTIEKQQTKESCIRARKTQKPYGYLKRSA
jgi:hypothetical protein